MHVNVRVFSYQFFGGVPQNGYLGLGIAMSSVYANIILTFDITCLFIVLIRNF